MKKDLEILSERETLTAQSMEELKGGTNDVVVIVVNCGEFKVVAKN